MGIGIIETTASVVVIILLSLLAVVCFLLLVFSFLLLLVFSFLLLLVFSFLLLTAPLISTQRCFRERVRVCVPVPVPVSVPVPVLEQIHSSLVVSDRMSYGDNLVPMLVLVCSCVYIG